MRDEGEPFRVRPRFHCADTTGDMCAMMLARFVLAAGLGLAAVLSVPAAGAQDTAPAQPPPKHNVERLFATSCGWCHQGGGRIQGRGPKLAGTEKTDDEIVRQIKNGKPPGMPAFGRAFNDEQIQAIVAYIRGLEDKP
jgi:mono/diheme cytochrome c family protein